MTPAHSRAVWLAVLLPACGGEGREARFPVPGEDGPRVTVEVLNGTPIDGLARRHTDRLRRHGLDVVFFGSAAVAVDSTRIVIRRGDSTAAIRVRDVLGIGRVVEEPDSRLLLDVTVLLGQDAARLDRDP